MMNVAELRQEYMRAGLSEVDADRDPVRQFEHWLEDALRARLPLPNAATLATVSEAGTPAARAVLLKGIERGGFVFYTNYRSRKGRELDARAAACLVFLWSDLERQVRIEGSVEKLSAEESDAYFATRPLGARLSAWASAQSERVPDRAALEASMEEARKRHGERPLRPPRVGPGTGPARRSLRQAAGRHPRHGALRRGMHRLRVRLEHRLARRAAFRHRDFRLGLGRARHGLHRRRRAAGAAPADHRALHRRLAARTDPGAALRRGVHGLGRVARLVRRPRRGVPPGIADPLRAHGAKLACSGARTLLAARHPPPAAVARAGALAGRHRGGGNVLLFRRLCLPRRLLEAALRPVVHRHRPDSRRLRAGRAALQRAGQLADPRSRRARPGAGRGRARLPAVRGRRRCAALGVYHSLHPRPGPRLLYDP